MESARLREDWIGLSLQTPNSLADHGVNGNLPRSLPPTPLLSQNLMFVSHSRLHVKKLKDEYLGEKVQRYFDLLPEVLREMFPDFDTMGEG